MTKSSNNPYIFEYTEDAKKAISKLPQSDKELIKKAIEYCLSQPHNRTPRCNMKRLLGSKYHTHRLHISMRFTVFYRIIDDTEKVLIVNIMGINQAHNKYKSI